MSSNDASPYGDMMFFASLKMMLLPSVAMMRCLPQNVAKPHIIREANIIRRSRHHLPKANIIQKDLFCPVDKRGLFVGAADRGRTGTMFPPRDFKSLVSAYSTTAAHRSYHTPKKAKSQV